MTVVLRSSLNWHCFEDKISDISNSWRIPIRGRVHPNWDFWQRNFLTTLFSTFPAHNFIFISLEYASLDVDSRKWEKADCISSAAQFLYLWGENLTFWYLIFCYFCSMIYEKFRFNSSWWLEWLGDWRCLRPGLRRRIDGKTPILWQSYAGT